MKKRRSEHLNKAHDIQNNEFYTKKEDVLYLINYYKKYFTNKIIYCNCDDYRISNYYILLKEMFNELNLKELRSTNYDIGDGSYYVKYDGKTETIIEIENGDYESEFCIEILKESDIVFTNPPFTNYRKILDIIIENDKDYILIAPKMFLTYYTKYEYKIHNSLNYNFIQPNKEEKRIGTIIINSFKNEYYGKTSGMIDKTNEEINLLERDDVTNIININKSKDIPKNYLGFMYVPISFMSFEDRLNYDIISLEQNVIINNKRKFKRFLIKRKQ